MNNSLEQLRAAAFYAKHINVYPAMFNIEVTASGLKVCGDLIHHNGYKDRIEQTISFEDLASSKLGIFHLVKMKIDELREILLSKKLP